MSPTARSAKQVAEAIRGGDRKAMAKAITLLESKRPEKAERGRAILEELVPHAGQSMRVGVTGPPGVGKSTFIESLGIYLLERGHQVAVLAVDPSSPVTGGSILGDKTRMERLAQQDGAYIRPSPSGGSLGGVADRTREAMLVCEAAGYDVILVETVGVGQSEVVVEGMVDFFLVLMLSGAGDELQGIKRGILEIADMIAVNKAEGGGADRANAAAAEYRAALHILTPASPNWTPPVITVSGLANEGLDRLWDEIKTHRDRLSETGELIARRAQQQVRWMWAMIEDRMHGALRSRRSIRERLAELEDGVREGRIAASVAADEIAAALKLAD